MDMVSGTKSVPFLDMIIFRKENACQGLFCKQRLPQALQLIHIMQ